MRLFISSCIFQYRMSAPAGLYADVVEHSDFQLNLRPPGRPFAAYSSSDVLLLLWLEEKLRDADRNLDAIMKVNS
jgi:hypothetical protein